MNIATMVSYFDILQDKYGSTYYTNAEKELFLQRAHIEFVKELLPVNEISKENIELSQDTISQIAPLIYELPFMNMDSSGIISKSSIQTALTNAVTGGILWRPLSIGLYLSGKNMPVKYVRHNDRWEFANNYFKKPSNTNPKVRETGTNYVFEPILTGAKVYFTVLKYPALVSISTPTNSDLPDHTHDRIVAIALELSGVASRDVALTQLLQLKQNG